MTTITTIDKKALNTLRTVLGKELTPILAEYGLKFKLGNARYQEDSVKFTGFRISLENAQDPSAKALTEDNEFRATHDFTTFDLDKVGVSPNGLEYKLVGYKPRNRKYPYICLSLEDNKRYKFTEDGAERMFGHTS